MDGLQGAEPHHHHGLDNYDHIGQHNDGIDHDHEGHHHHGHDRSVLYHQHDDGEGDHYHVIALYYNGATLDGYHTTNFGPADHPAEDGPAG